MQIAHILRSFFAPATFMYINTQDNNKNFKEVGAWFFDWLTVLITVYLLLILPLQRSFTSHKFIFGVPIVLSIFIFYLAMYVFYSHQQKALFSQKVIKGRQMFASLQKANMPEKIYLIKNYIDHVNVLKNFELFGYRKIRKNIEAKLDVLMGETYAFISGLSSLLPENQEYFILFADMENSVRHHDFINSIKYGDADSCVRMLHIQSIREKMDNVCVNYIISKQTLDNILGLLIITFLIVGFTAYNNYIEIILFLSLFFVANIIGIMDDSKGYIQKQKDSITGAFTGLSLSFQAFLICKDSTMMLMKSEQGVQGIEPVMVSKIAKNITYVMKYWNQYQYNIDYMYKLLSDRWGYFLTPRNPYKFVQDIIDEEHLRGEKGLAEFQSILKSWMISHTKDLQNYQQEIHQIHQSLSQKNSANAEVIDLLEKNFNLHLQSAQKVENSI